MKLKKSIWGIFIALLLVTTSCNNDAGMIPNPGNDERQELELTQEEIRNLEIEGEDVEAFLESINARSSNDKTAAQLILDYLKGPKKHYKKLSNTKLGDLYFIEMKGEGPGGPGYTASEATGYGMRLAIYGWKGIKVTCSQAYIAKAAYKKIFDNLYRTQDLFRSQSYYVDKSKGISYHKITGLHSWIIPKSLNQKDIYNTAATDGEMDMAYALLQAHKLWGSNGSINYKAEALKKLKAIAKYLTNTATVNGKKITFLKVGDWVHWEKDAPKYADMHSRPCDWMIHHFKTFYYVLGREGEYETARTFNDLWNSAEYMLDNRNHSLGKLLPDFVYLGDGKISLAKKEFAVDLMKEDVVPEHYSWNSCRIPWRIAEHRQIDKCEGSNNLLRQIYDATNWGSDIFKTGSEYKLDGTIVNNNFETAFAAPITLSIIGRQAYAKSGPEAGFFAYKKIYAKRKISTQYSGDPEWGYFGDSILCFSMLLLENNKDIISPNWYYNW